MPPDVLGRLAEGYRRDNVALSDQTGDDVGAIFDAVDLRRFVPIAAAVVAHANRRSVVRAHRFVADALSVALGRPAVVDALDAAAFADPDQLARAISTAIAREAPVTADVEARFRIRNRVVRIGRAEPLATGQKAAQVQMQRDRRVRGAVRQTGSNPCPICSAKAGARVPLGASVSSHPHCSCVAVPTTEIGEP